jgi:hypothetical protein
MACLPATSLSPTVHASAGGVSLLRYRYPTWACPGRVGFGSRPYARGRGRLEDTLANISDTSLDQHSDAAVHAILTFAQTTSSVSGTNPASMTATKDWDWKGDHLVR